MWCGDRVEGVRRKVTVEGPEALIIPLKRIRLYALLGVRVRDSIRKYSVSSGFNRRGVRESISKARADRTVLVLLLMLLVVLVP